LEYRYWDSNCFLCWLKKEPAHGKCTGVIRKAEEGEIQIVTSALTIAEVIYMKGEDKIDRKKSDEICRFFEHEYIVPINVDRTIAEVARLLLWDYKALRPQDAIHIASALKAKVPIFDTFDEYLIGLNGTIGNPPIIIGQPNIPHQEDMPYDKNEDEEISETTKE
jgi:predicted nucleic acid-binding protein